MVTCSILIIFVTMLCGVKNYYVCEYIALQGWPVALRPYSLVLVHYMVMGILVFLLGNL